MCKLINPYSIEEMLKRLRNLLSITSTARPWYKDAIELLDKAVERANQDTEYAQEMERALLYGSTVDLRAWLSVFGDYMQPPRSTYPWYPFADAVNAIDSAMHVIKRDAAFPGEMDEYLEFVLGQRPSAEERKDVCYAKPNATQR